MTSDRTTSPVVAVIRNEFAVVELSCVQQGSSVSLIVTDVASGGSIVLDANELESLTQASHECLRRLLREPDDEPESRMSEDTAVTGRTSADDRRTPWLS